MNSSTTGTGLTAISPVPVPWTPKPVTRVGGTYRNAPISGHAPMARCRIKEMRHNQLPIPSTRVTRRAIIREVVLDEHTNAWAD
jgi:hypothetical protein